MKPLHFWRMTITCCNRRLNFIIWQRFRCPFYDCFWSTSWLCEKLKIGWNIKKFCDPSLLKYLLPIKNLNPMFLVFLFLFFSRAHCSTSVRFLFVANFDFFNLALNISLENLLISIMVMYLVWLRIFIQLKQFLY